MKVVVYPRNIVRNGLQENPYINDFILSLEQSGIVVTNRPHKNPLFSLLPKKRNCDAYIFHWLENVPDYKYGMVQMIAAICLLLHIKLMRKKLIWFLHNKQPHLLQHRCSKNLLIWFLLHLSDLIITHASEGIEVVEQRYKKAASKTVFLHHPTKNRIDSFHIGKGNYPIQTDLLIWGNVNRYKGVIEFVRFAYEHQFPCRIKVIGKCASEEIYEGLRLYANQQTTIENRSISFEELAEEVQKARYVLIPYAPETILSSGVLMDSLSLGARVIGPNVGSFRDYKQNPLVKVETFNSFNDILSILHRNNTPPDVESYKQFLNQYSWDEFGKTFSHILQNLK